MKVSLEGNDPTEPKRFYTAQSLLFLHFYEGSLLILKTLNLVQAILRSLELLQIYFAILVMTVNDPLAAAALVLFGCTLLQCLLL